MAAVSPTPPPEQQLTALYLVAETYLLAQASRILRATLNVGPLAAMPRLRRLVAQVSAQLAAQTGPLVQAMTAQQAARARQDADKQVARYSAPDAGSPGTGGPPPPGKAFTIGSSDEYFNLSMDHGDRAAQLIRADLESALEDVRRRLTRLPDDIYKAIAPQAAIGQVVDNNATPEQAQAAAWRVFTQSGVTGFTDKGGRDWQLSSYVEMAVRTAANRAYNASHTARMNAVGIHYFTVPEHVNACPQCFPWQHGVLTDLETPDPAVPVIGTVADAVAAGWNHPNCRCTLVAYFPGITPVPEPKPWTGEDELRYRATQKQRALEVAVRKAKVAERTALTPEARQEAKQDIRAGERRIRAHLEQHPYLGRQSRREQPNLRMDRQNLTPWQPPPGPKPPYSDGSAPDWTAAVP